MLIKVFIELDYDYVGAVEGFVEWNYPVLPQIGDSVSSPLLFIPEKFKEEFKKVSAVQALGDRAIPEFDYDDDTFYDYLCYMTHNLYIQSVEWCFTDELEKGNYRVFPFFTIVTDFFICDDCAESLLNDEEPPIFPPHQMN